MSKIKKAFENGKALITFITCGDPDLETTAAAVCTAVENGADIIELGIPFSDPTAEGPIIQASNLRALNNGVATDKIFAFVKKLRCDVKVPILFMTYANVVFSYGTEHFISSCKDIGIGGLIIYDLPFEEKEEFQPFCKKYGVDLLSQIAPAAENRIAMISKEAEGFLYCSMPEEKGQIKTDLISIVNTVRKNSDIPCVIGSGVSAPEQVGKMMDIFDGVVIDSSIIELIEKYGKAAPKYIGEYIKSIKAAIR